MATIQRNVKTYGNRNFVAEVASAPSNYAPILANEVDKDLDDIYAAWNGGTDTVNLKDGSVTFAKLAPDAQLWRDTGTILTPGVNFATRPVQVPGPASATTDTCLVKLGQRTQKVREHALPTLDYAAWTINNTWDGANWVRDDTSKTAWRTVQRTDLDSFAIEYTSAAGAASQPFVVSGTGGPGATALVQTTGFLRGRAFAGGIYSAVGLPWGSRIWAQIPMATIWISNAGMTAIPHIVRAPAFDCWVMVSLFAVVDVNNGGWFFEIQAAPDGTTWVQQAQITSLTSQVYTLNRLMPVVANTQFRGYAFNNDTVLHNITRCEMTLSVIGQT